MDRPFHRQQGQRPGAEGGDQSRPQSGQEQGQISPEGEEPPGKGGVQPPAQVHGGQQGPDEQQNGGQPGEQGGHPAVRQSEGVQRPSVRRFHGDQHPVLVQQDLMEPGADVLQPLRGSNAAVQQVLLRHGRGDQLGHAGGDRLPHHGVDGGAGAGEQGEQTVYVQPGQPGLEVLGEDQGAVPPARRHLPLRPGQGGEVEGDHQAGALLQPFPEGLAPRLREDHPHLDGGGHLLRGEEGPGPEGDQGQQQEQEPAPPAGQQGGSEQGKGKIHRPTSPLSARRR